MSDLTLENRANPFSVPQVAITNRAVTYRSGIHFTPLRSDTVIDAAGVRDIVAEEYEKAGLRREEVQTGAVIITGETARKENAREVLAALSDSPGTLWWPPPAPIWSPSWPHGGRGPTRSPGSAAAGCSTWTSAGEPPTWPFLKTGNSGTPAASTLAAALEAGPGGPNHLLLPGPGGVDRGRSGAGARPGGTAPARRTSSPCWRPCGRDWRGPSRQGCGCSPFPGAWPTACGTPPADWRAFGDMGPLLGPALRRRLEAGGLSTLVRGAETIRATVVGAGAHSVEVSGSTIHCRGVDFPLKNLPVLRLERSGRRGGPPEASGGGQSAEKARLVRRPGGPLRQVALALAGGASRLPTGGWRSWPEGTPGGAGSLWCQAGLFSPWWWWSGTWPRSWARPWGATGPSAVPGRGESVREGDYIDIGAPVAGGSRAAGGGEDPGLFRSYARRQPAGVREEEH